MRVVLILLTSDRPFLTTGRYSYSTKKSESDSTEQSSPTPSGLGRY